MPKKLIKIQNYTSDACSSYVTEVNDSEDLVSLKSKLNATCITTDDFYELKDNYCINDIMKITNTLHTFSKSFIDKYGYDFEFGVSVYKHFMIQKSKKMLSECMSGENDQEQTKRYKKQSEIVGKREKIKLHKHNQSKNAKAKAKRDKKADNLTERKNEQAYKTQNVVIAKKNKNENEMPNEAGFTAAQNTESIDFAVNRSPVETANKSLVETVNKSLAETVNRSENNARYDATNKTNDYKASASSAKMESANKPMQNNNPCRKKLSLPKIIEKEKLQEENAKMRPLKTNKKEDDDFF